MKEKLYELGIDLLKRGYKIITHNIETYYHVTDGHHVLYLQNQYFTGVSMAFPYKPTQKLGGACKIMDDVDSVGDVIRVFKALKADYSVKTLYEYNDMLREEKAVPELYQSFEEWYDELWDKKDTTVVTTVEEFTEMFDTQ